MKIFISIVAIVLTFVGYVPYIRDTFIGKTKPHIFSWLVWTITTSIIYALQVSAGAGPGSWVTLAVIIVLLIVLLLGLKNGNKNIKKIDIVFLVLALVSIPIWLVVKQPVVSIILLSTIEMIGFLPTIRKSWNDPYSETLSLYIITTFRHGLSIFALAEYNIITWLFPATWVFANAVFSIILIVRRKKLKKGV
mgnify:CR=1 FL=1